MRTILVHGASTAAGWYDMEHAGWANRLHLNALKANQLNPAEAIMVQNTSIPGNTLPALMRDLSQIDRFQRLGKVTTILALGLNEAKIMKNASRPLVSLKRFKSALNEYGNYTESRGVNTVYVGTEMMLIDTIVTENENTFENDLVAEYDYLIEQEATKRGVPYLSPTKIFTEIGPDCAIAPDGYHPSALGHAALHSSIVSALEPFEPFAPLEVEPSSEGRIDITTDLIAAKPSRDN